MLGGECYNQNESGWHVIKFWTPVCTPLPGFVIIGLPIPHDVRGAVFP